jgi:hypothetical protein
MKCPPARRTFPSRRANADLDPNLSMGFDLAREVRLFYVTSPRAVTCIGQPQHVEFAWAAATTTPGTAKVPMTVTLATSEGRVSDTQDIYMTTRFRQPPKA